MKQLKFLRLFTCVSTLAAMMLVSCTSTPQGESAQSAENWKPYDKNGEMIRTDRNATGKIGVVSTSKVEAGRIGAEKGATRSMLLLQQVLHWELLNRTLQV